MPGFRVRGQPLELRSLKGKLDFSESRMLWSDLEGQANDGRIASRGDVRWRRFRPEQLEVAVQLDQVSVRLLEDAPFAASGELTVTGRPSSFLVAGDLDVQRLRYRRPFGFDTLLARANRSSTPGEAPSEWLQLDVALHLKDAAVENNLARARIVGDVRLTGSNLHPGLVGAIEAGPGSQAFFRGTTFNITQGAVDFKDRRSLEGVFDVRAESQVRDYLVRLHAFGKTSQPQVLLSSEPGLPEGDIISLLTLGVTSRDRSNTASTPGRASRPRRSTRRRVWTDRCRSSSRGTTCSATSASTSPLCTTTRTAWWNRRCNWSRSSSPTSLSSACPSQSPARGRGPTPSTASTIASPPRSSGTTCTTTCRSETWGSISSSVGNVE